MVDHYTDPTMNSQGDPLIIKRRIQMYRRLGYLVAGIAVGALLTGYLDTKEIQQKTEEQQPATQHDGLFAEVNGSTVRLYKVEAGRFCGYHETREFDSQEEAVEWVLKETKAKLQFTAE